MARYGFASIVTDANGGLTVTAGMLDASNKFEADGKALAITRKIYPSSDGWREHAVSTSLPDMVVTPESVVLSPKS